MASAQVVETSVNNNSPSQDSYHPDDLFQSRYAAPGFKPFSYEVFSFTSKVKFYGASFPGRKEGICSKSVRNVGTSSAVFPSTERTTRKLRIGRIRREFSCNCYAAKCNNRRKM